MTAQVESFELVTRLIKIRYKGTAEDFDALAKDARKVLLRAKKEIADIIEKQGVRSGHGVWVSQIDILHSAADRARNVMATATSEAHRRRKESS
jgi:hypothetical protein